MQTWNQLSKKSCRWVWVLTVTRHEDLRGWVRVICFVCLSGVSTYLFTATCCAQQDAHTRVPDWHFQGGDGVWSISRSHGDFDAVPYSIANTVSSLLTRSVLILNKICSHKTKNHLLCSSNTATVHTMEHQLCQLNKRTPSLVVMMNSLGLNADHLMLLILLVLYDGCLTHSNPVTVV